MNVMERTILRTIFCCIVVFVLVTTQPVSAQIFTSVNSGILGTQSGSTIAGDFDGDGNMDLLLDGINGDYLTAIWRNLTNGTFSDYKELGGAYGSIGIGDFYNTGRLDAIVMDAGGDQFPELWHNLGGGNFTFINNTLLPPIAVGWIALGDFDNDGKMDFVISGYTNSNHLGIPRTRMCRNLGNGNFAVSTAGLTGLGSVFAGDFNNDGYLDLIVGTKLWQNLGNGTFTNVSSGLPNDVLAVADMNNDGYLDVIVDNGAYQIWLNVGDGTFTNSDIALPAVSGPAGLYPPVAAVGDYDNDGLLDIVLQTGQYYSPSAQVFHNQGDGTFTNSQSIFGATLGSLTWGDFNNDGQLDFALVGQQGTDSNANPIVVAQLWQNTLATSNSPPTAPTNLTSHLIGGSGVRLNWGAATDDHTPASGLNYNIRVGSLPGALDIVSPMADPVTGKRLVVQIGNAQTRLFSILTNLTGGTYYWSVQAIDTAFAGGAFATESTFVIPPSISGWAYQTNGQFQVNFNALAGSSYTLQASSNLMQWAFVASVIPGAVGLAQLTDTNASSFPARYYRLSCP